MERIEKAAAFVSGLKGWRLYLGAFIAGAIMPLSLAPTYFVLVMALSFTSLIWMIDGISSNKRPLKRGFAIGWWFGFGFHLTGLYWIGFAFLVDAEQFAWAIPFAVTVMPAGLALFSAGAVALACRFWTEGTSRIVMFALCWMTAEWLRGNILTGFPWNLPGYTWMGFLPIAQLGAVIGIYGLSLLTVFLCALPASLITRSSGEVSFHIAGAKKLALAIGALAILTAGGAWRIGAQDLPAVEGVSLRLIQANIPQKEKWKEENRYQNFNLYLEMTGTVAPGAPEPTHIIWPESAVPIFLSTNPAARAEIAGVLKPSQVLLTGAVRYEQIEKSGALTNKLYNSFHLIDSDGAIQATYDKYHLVPFGEYLPLSALLSKIGLRKLTQGVGAYAPGLGPDNLPVPGAGPVAPLICYEAIFPGRMKRATDRPGSSMSPMMHGMRTPLARGNIWPRPRCAPLSKACQWCALQTQVFQPLSTPTDVLRRECP